MNKNEIRKIKKGIDLLDLVLKDLKTVNGNTENIFPMLRRNSFYHLFYNENRIDELFLAIIPTKELEYLSRILSIVRSANGFVTGGYENAKISGVYGGDILLPEFVEGLKMLRGHLQSALILYGYNVFYSWQSDSPNKTNRNFIESTLERAVKDAAKATNLPLQLDKDTANREGSPIIAWTILEKIDDCRVFVADITNIVKTFDGKQVYNAPNPNVLYELGYAHGVLGDSNIIMVCNTAFGPLEDLPFDLRDRKITKYCLDENADEETRKEEKAKLVSQLKNNITKIVDSTL